MKNTSFGSLSMLPEGSHRTMVSIAQRSANATLPAKLAQRFNADLLAVLDSNINGFIDIYSALEQEADANNPSEEFTKLYNECVVDCDNNEQQFRTTCNALLSGANNDNFVAYFRRMVMKILGPTEKRMYTYITDNIPSSTIIHDGKNKGKYRLSSLESDLLFNFGEHFHYLMKEDAKMIFEKMKENGVVPAEQKVKITSPKSLHPTENLHDEVLHESHPDIEVILSNDELRKKVNTQTGLLALSQTVLIEILRGTNFRVIESRRYFSNPKVLREVVEFLLENGREILEDGTVRLINQEIYPLKEVSHIPVSDSDLGNAPESLKHQSKSIGVIKDYKSKLAITDICKKHDITSPTLYKILRDNLIPLRRRSVSVKAAA